MAAQVSDSRENHLYDDGDTRTHQSDVFEGEFQYQKGTSLGDELRGVLDHRNFLSSSSASHTITGGNLNDIINGGGGDDTIDGGDGEDLAIYDGELSEYSINVQDNGTLLITDNVGDEGTDAVTNVELFVFNGTLYSFEELVAYAQTGDSSEDDDLDSPEGGDLDRFDPNASDNGADSSELPGENSGNADGNSPGDSSLNVPASGSAGNDIFSPTGEAQLMDGGDGDADIFQLKGLRSEYEISKNEDGSITIIDTVPYRDGTNTIINIEFFAFYNEGDWLFFSRDELLNGESNVQPANQWLMGTNISNGTDELVSLDAGSGDAGLYQFILKLSNYFVTFNEDGSITFVDTSGFEDEPVTVINGELFWFGNEDIYSWDELQAAVEAGESHDGTGITNADILDQIEDQTTATFDI